MSFITVAEAETIIGTDFSSLSDSDKTRFVLLANTWMKNDIGYEPETIDDVLKQAACEIIKGIQAGDIYAGIARYTLSEIVKADTVSTSETYEAGTREISSYEEIATALIQSTGVKLRGFSFGVYRA